MLTNDADGQVSLFDQDSPYGKTCPERTAPIHRRPSREATFRLSSRRSSGLKNHTLMLLDLRPGAGNMLGSYWEIDPPWLGSPGGLNCSACPRPAIGSSLLQILEDTAPIRYYLSRRACLGILRRAQERGKPLPQRLEMALRLQAGLPADRGLDCDGTSVAGFSAGAGATAGGIGYSEEVVPTLKASQSGNMMPSVLCLNDQGGGRMGHGVEVSGTLRAQEHGHQPLVLYENHGIDARYTGPREVAPTMSARYGTGGNNLPLIAHEEDSLALFVRQRADSFQESDTASTESARQYKDATDLVLQTNEPACFLIRRLLVVECERLQGFPDGWTDLPDASDSVRYKALGNSVPVPCVEYLLKGISKAAGYEDWL